MNYQTRLILGAFKEFILSLDRTDALFVLILILCMGFGRSGAEPPSVYGSKSSLPSVAPGFPPPPYRAASQPTSAAQ